MKLLTVLFLLFASQVFAAPPTGWVEMLTPEPIILSWTKMEKGIKLEDSPIVMIQKHDYTAKWKSALEGIPQDQKKCQKIKAEKSGEWDQLYCQKGAFLYAFLWKGDPKETAVGLSHAQNWLDSNE